MTQEFIKHITKGKRLTPCESDHALIEFLQAKNHAKNWVIFVLLIALIFSNF